MPLSLSSISFIVSAVISGLLCAIVSIGMTYSIKHLGGIKGSIIATVPSTIIPPAIMLAINMNNNDLLSVMSSVPIGVFLNFTMLLVWRIAPKFLTGFIRSHFKKVLTLLIISLVLWAILAIGIIKIIHAIIDNQVEMRILSLGAVVIQFILLIPTIIFGTSVATRGEGHLKKRYVITTSIFACICGSLTLFLCFFDKVSAGVLLAFPVVFICSLATLAFTYAVNLPSSATTSMIGGSVSTSVFSMIFTELTILFDYVFKSKDGHRRIEGVLISILICWVITTFGFSLPLFSIIKYRERNLKRNMVKIDFNDLLINDSSSNEERESLI